MDQSQDTVTIVHEFGTIEVSASAIMRFPEPIWGFAAYTEYALLPASRAGLWWLIATGDVPCTFVLADPFVINADYAIDLGDSERQALSIHEPSDAFALVMLTLPASPSGSVTANLRAPIVFNLGRQLAAQIVSRDDAHALQHPVDLTVYPPQEGGLRMT